MLNWIIYSSIKRFGEEIYLDYYLNNIGKSNSIEYI